MLHWTNSHSLQFIFHSIYGKDNAHLHHFIAFIAHLACWKTKSIRVFAVEFCEWERLNALELVSHSESDDESEIESLAVTESTETMDDI